MNARVANDLSQPVLFCLCGLITFLIAVRKIHGRNNLREEGRTLLGRWLEGTVHHGEEAMVAGLK